MRVGFRARSYLNSSLVVVSSALTLLVVCVGFSRAEELVVQTTLGNVTGSVEEVTFNDDIGTEVTEQFVQFLGIPYAEPPLGNRRFTKPEPKSAWTEPHNGTFYRPSCHHGNQQVTSSFDVVDDDISEDCLTLDIYSPFSINSSTPYTVLVFIHSSPSSSRAFVADVLSSYGQVVVVVINYRQGYLGFFSVGNDSVSGNYGLWDQHLAISWVNEHIVNFNGDPDMVTLVGHSTGASDAILQTLYAGNMGKIKGVVAMSGTPIQTYSTNSFMMTSVGDTLATMVGCGNRSSQDTFTCLRTKSLQDLDAAVSASKSNMNFKPVIDGDFIKANPHEIITSDGNMYAAERDGFLGVDLLLGLNNKEGGAHVGLMWAQLLGTNVSSFDIDSSQVRQIVVPTAMRLIFGGNISESVIETVNFQYSDITDPTNVEKPQQNVVDLSTDIDIAAPLVKTANAHSMKNISATFVYQFSEEVGALNPLTPSWLDGANRADDVYSLFGFSQRVLHTLANGTNFTPTVNQRMASRYMMTTIAIFAKTG